MLAFRWFEVFLLLLCVGSTILTNEGQEVRFAGSINKPKASLFLDLNQTDANTILNFQTSLRRYLINSLGDIREKITEGEGFKETIDEIIQGLQTRTTDPFKTFRVDKKEVTEMAEVIYNLQGTRGFSLDEWKSLLKAVPYSDLSKLQRIPENLQIYTTGTPFVITVLNKIQKNNLNLTGRLLRDILYNYPFRDYSPDLGIILDNIGQMLEEISLDFSDIRFEETSADEILSSILKFISKNHPSNPELVYQIAQIQPKLYLTGNTPLITDVPELWRLFDLMLPDDYPPDIVQTKNDLSSMVKDNQVGLNLSKVGERFKGHHPRERLLMLIVKLTSFPLVRTKAQAVYPHVKLWHLSLLGKFFHPQTATDVAFLLDSFLTAPVKMNPIFMNEMRKIFLLPDFNWKEVLKDFDYSRYSKPRPLVLNMVQELLNNSSKLPVCCVILLDYFLRNTREISCSPSTHDVFSGTISSSVISSDVQTHPSPLGRFISTIMPLSADSVTDSQSFVSFETVSTHHTITTPQNSEFDVLSDLSTLFTYSETPSPATFSQSSDSVDNSTEIIPMDYTSQLGTMTTTPEHSFPPNVEEVSEVSTQVLPLSSTIPFNSRIELISSTTESDFKSLLESTTPAEGSKPPDT